MLQIFYFVFSLYFCYFKRYYNFSFTIIASYWWILLTFKFVWMVYYLVCGYVGYRSSLIIQVMLTVVICWNNHVDLHEDNDSVEKKWNWLQGQTTRQHENTQRTRTIER